MGFGVEKGVAVKPTPEHELPRGKARPSLRGDSVMNFPLAIHLEIASHSE